MIEGKVYLGDKLISGGGEAAAPGWQPQSDWIDISTVNDNEINLLISDSIGTGLAFKVTTASGTYSIDWGDGTIQTGRVSGVKYEHQYTRGAGQACSLGYTTFKCRIYGATADITRFYIQKSSFQSNNQSCPILWAVFGTNGITSYANAFYETLGYALCYDLQAVKIPSFASCTSCSYMLRQCYSLQSLTLPSDWGSVTDCSLMIHSCNSLQSLTLPASWGNVNNCYYMLAYCNSLQSLTFPTSWGNVTDCSYMLAYCNSLQSLTLPSDWGNVTNCSYMLNGCNSLQSLTLPSDWGNVTNCSYMLSNCYSLQYLTNYEYLGSQTAQSNFTSAFQYCEMLTTLSIGSLLSAFGAQGGGSTTKNKLNSLRLTNAGSTFTGSSPQINVSYTSLSVDALVALFNDLPTLTNKTINITGSTGAAALTSEQRAIATGKGWTITG